MLFEDEVKIQYFERKLRLPWQGRMNQQNAVDKYAVDLNKSQEE